MTTMSDLYAEFDDRAVLRGGLRLFRPADAIDLIRKCREAGVRVLGLDAFRVFPNAIQPDMEHSIDYSSPPYTRLLQNSWQHAERFVRDREATAFFVEVVLDVPAD
jgi:hypothetical protein